VSDTTKDRAKVRTNEKTWEIVGRPDGTFKLFHNSKLVHGSISDRWLEDELGKYGFCGQEYEDIRRQLSEFGKVKIVL